MKRVALLLVLALSLVFGLTPAYATGGGSLDSPSSGQDQASAVSEGQDGLVGTDQGVGTEQSEPESETDSSDVDKGTQNKTGFIDELKDDDATLEPQATSEEPAPLSVIGGSYVYRVELEQVAESTLVNVTLPETESLLSMGRVDTVVVEATMNYQGTVTRNISAQKTLEELASTSGAFEMDFMAYGKFTVVAKFFKDGSLVQTGDVQTMGVTASEYNIAPVSASLPVAFFSLCLWGENPIRYNEAGGIVPTIMLMERPNAWDWDNLPEGVYPLPYLSKEAVSYQPSDFTEASNNFRANSSAMASYVKDLYEMDPNAKFNVYVVDFYAGLIQSIIYANGIPQDHYSITILSDGSFSYSQFNGVYNGSNPARTHEALKASWLEAKSYAYNNGAVKNGFALNLPNQAIYAAVDCEPNAQWWLARPALLESKGDGNAFGTNAQSNAKVVRYYIDKKLQSLQSVGGKAAVEEFKSLYNFSDTYFAGAESQGKDVMLFLGTTVGSEAGSFSDYARFTMTLYGDRYQYYYKGHPGSPTEFYSQKQDELSSLGITDVDSSIAAELILFFYPDIYLSGYTSSTYASLQNPDMAKGLFRITKQEALANESYAVMDWFISPVTAASKAEIRALCGTSKCYLVEFSDKHLKTADYSIAIWNSDTGTIGFYKQENGGYEFVKSQGGNKSNEPCVISAGVNQSKVIDIAAASIENSANVQIYENNRSLAQRYRLIQNADQSYIIQNVNSGRVLDVAGAAKVEGTNVWQYERNDSDAQKWALIPVSGKQDTYNIVSKCNGLYLDVSAASSANGTNIHVWTGNGTNAQEFKITKLSPVIQDGAYTVLSSLSGRGAEIALDVSSGSLDDGANVQIWEKNGTQAQLFSFTYDSANGCYTLQNVQSGKALDAMYGGSVPGTNVWQYMGNGTNAQKWTLEASKDSSGRDCLVVYSSGGGGCCLDVSGANRDSGSNVQLWSPNGTDAQKWMIAS